MFTVNATEADLIRTAFLDGGEFSAAVEFRRLFPGITDTAKARQWARVIAGWQPRPTDDTAVTPLRPRKLRRT